MTKLKKECRLAGILTIELAYLFLMIFSIFLLIIYTIFYYHDKLIILGTAKETAVLWAQLSRKPEEENNEDPYAFFEERISGKLILFSGVNVSVNEIDGLIEVIARAEKGMFSVEEVGLAAIVKPEEKIRNKRVLENLAGQEG